MRGIQRPAFVSASPVGEKGFDDMTWQRRAAWYRNTGCRSCPPRTSALVAGFPVKRRTNGRGEEEGSDCPENDWEGASLHRNAKPRQSQAHLLTDPSTMGSRYWRPCGLERCPGGAPFHLPAVGGRSFQILPRFRVQGSAGMDRLRRNHVCWPAGPGGWARRRDP